MKKVIDELLIEATILGMVNEGPQTRKSTGIRPGKKNDVEVVNYKAKDGSAKIMNVPVALRQQPDHPARIAAEKLRNDKEDSDSQGGEEDTSASSARQGQKSDDSDLDVFGDEPTSDDKEEEETENKGREYEVPSPKERKKLLKQDEANTDKALSMTKEAVAAQTAAKGKKDVGLGTPESRAGEAVTHKAMRLLKEGRSEEEVRTELMKIADRDDTVLTPEWVDAGIRSTNAALRSLGGIENIEDIVWDTPQGREAIGVGEHGTSADMFVRTKDGKRMGVSLKKDGSVFLANKGYGEETRKLISKLEEMGVDPSAMNQASLNTYEEGIAQQFNNAAETVIGDKKLQKDFMKVANGPLKNKIRGGEVEKAGKPAPQAFLQKFIDGKPSANDKKALSRICQYSDNPELKQMYSDMRNEDTKLTQRLLNVFNENEEIGNGMKEYILENIHFESTLDLDQNPELDGFMTIYGSKPDGIELSQESLLKLFGGKTRKLYEISEQWQQTDDPKEKEKIRKQISEQAEEKIYIDYKDGAKGGTIKIKGENGSDYPLFTIGSRSRGIGTSPILEIAQTTFMTNSLKNGSFDADDWEPGARKVFYNARLKELKENMATQKGNKAAEKEISTEMKNVEKKLNESISYDHIQTLIEMASKV
jgi:hypothetical protein